MYIFFNQLIRLGATRNFEALKRAEEQAEREDQAHREELENNPMKMLEVRLILLCPLFPIWLKRSNVFLEDFICMAGSFF